MLIEMHQDILSRLTPIVEGTHIQLRLTPDSPDAYLRAVAVPQIILILPESRFDPPETQGEVIQTWRLRYQLEFRLPSYWSGTGLLSLLEAAIALLQGYRPPQATEKIHMDRTVLDGEFRDCWVKRLVFWTSVRVRGPKLPEHILPLIEQIAILQPDDSVMLTVTDPDPEAVASPTGLMASQSDGAIAVEWTTPDDNSSDHELLGHVLQLEVSGVWAYSQLIAADESDYIYSDIGGVSVANVRARAMWSCGYSDWVIAAL